MSRPLARKLRAGASPSDLAQIAVFAYRFLSELAKNPKMLRRILKLSITRAVFRKKKHNRLKRKATYISNSEAVISEAELRQLIVGKLALWDFVCSRQIQAFLCVLEHTVFNPDAR
jgi:hypothetical protein